MHCATWTLDLTPQYDSAPGLGSPETLIPQEEESSEEDRPFLPRFLLQEDYLRALGRTRGLSQPAKPARESPVQNRLASLARNCGDRVHDSSRFESSLPFLGAVCANSSKQGSAPRRNGPCRPQRRFSTSFAGSLVQCLGSGSLGRADSPCSGRTDSIHGSDPALRKLRLDVDGN